MDVHVAQLFSQYLDLMPCHHIKFQINLKIQSFKMGTHMAKNHEKLLEQAEQDSRLSMSDSKMLE